jgi:hypothetical protein
LGVGEEDAVSLSVLECGCLSFCGAHPSFKKKQRSGWLVPNARVRLHELGVWGEGMVTVISRPVAVRVAWCVKVGRRTQLSWQVGDLSQSMSAGGYVLGVQCLYMYHGTLSWLL